MILALPKSASTSLMKGLSSVTGLNAVQVLDSRECDIFGKLVLKAFRKFDSSQRPVSKFENVIPSSLSYSALKNLSPCGDFYALSAFHSDICELNGFNDHQLAGLLKFPIQKQHFPPSLGNIEKLASVPKLLLLSDPEEVLESYERVPDGPFNITAKKLLKSSPEYRARLLEELRLWGEGWKECITSNYVFSKDHLLSDPLKVVEAALDLSGIKPKAALKDFELPKERVYR